MCVSANIVFLFKHMESLFVVPVVMLCCNVVMMRLY